MQIKIRRDLLITLLSCKGSWYKVLVNISCQYLIDSLLIEQDISLLRIRKPFLKQCYFFIIALVPLIIKSLDNADVMARVSISSFMYCECIEVKYFGIFHFTFLSFWISQWNLRMCSNYVAIDRLTFEVCDRKWQWHRNVVTDFFAFTVKSLQLDNQNARALLNRPPYFGVTLFVTVTAHVLVILN